MTTLQTELNNEFVGKTVTITPSADNKQWTIKVDNVEETVPAGKDDTPQVATLPSSEGTKPYFPKTDGTWHQIDGTTLTNGLVITDAIDEEGNSIGNEYVWIEVPRTATTYGSSFDLNYDFDSMTKEQKNTAYTTIATALRTYCAKDVNGADLIKNGTSSDGTYGSTSTYGYTDIWYDGSGKAEAESTNTSDITGCGLTNLQYTELYNKMLKSVYENGGFWIGRYEAGQTGDTGRENVNASIDGILPLSKPNLIPIFNITCNQAQTMAGKVKNIDNAKYTSSLMFGIQWDLVIRHLSNKGVENSLLIGDSSSWGNYSITTNATLTGGKYTPYMIFPESGAPSMTFNTWYEYNVDLGDYIQGGVLLKNASMPKAILLTTGISSKFNKKNIYDLAGNLSEYTLEMSTETNGPCTARGLCFSAAAGSVSYRCGASTSGELTPFNSRF